ncbi:polysaccharide biosynthesis-domain-containing protein, partial [Baffinella frigidus]
MRRDATSSPSPPAAPMEYSEASRRAAMRTGRSQGNGTRDDSRVNWLLLLVLILSVYIQYIRSELSATQDALLRKWDCPPASVAAPAWERGHSGSAKAASYPSTRSVAPPPRLTDELLDARHAGGASNGAFSPGLAEHGEVAAVASTVQLAPPLAEPHAGQIAAALMPALAAGGNLLVFGMAGNAPEMARRFNPSGTTVFVDDNFALVTALGAGNPSIKFLHVSYHTSVSKDFERLKDPQTWPALRLPLPLQLVDTSWDAIYVAGPSGSTEQVPGTAPTSSPGCFQSIYTASILARASAAKASKGVVTVLVDDCERPTESRGRMLGSRGKRERTLRKASVASSSHQGRLGAGWCLLGRLAGLSLCLLRRVWGQARLLWGLA